MIGDHTYLTSEGLEKLQAELKQLKQVRRKEIADKIERAKELGDLSENAEYQEAKEEQGFIEGRIIELETIINSATIVTGQSGTKQVNIGNTVRVRQNGNERTFSIVGANEADPTAGKISNESPLGRSLLGRRVGEQVTVRVPKGDVEYTITEIG
ncbi:transcription elongation factor GreA [Candidatus Uhrbacteria bacterium]|nr:transcription elongation factor GreA [Candidatus Uhrbacteria bacterium]